MPLLPSQALFVMAKFRISQSADTAEVEERLPPHWLQLANLGLACLLLVILVSNDVVLHRRAHMQIYVQLPPSGN